MVTVQLNESVSAIGNSYGLAPRLATSTTVAPLTIISQASVSIEGSAILGSVLQLIDASSILSRKTQQWGLRHLPSRLSACDGHVPPAPSEIEPVTVQTNAP